jgi:NAD(P)-dependent dehydrogenase (short-subunit alcohol dehydrogenase family)
MYEVTSRRRQVMNVNYPKTAVITGASSGIGRALSLALAREGWKVGIVDIDMEQAEETRRMVREAGGEGEVFQANVRVLQEVMAAADHFFDLWGEVGMLVNNAGIGGGGFVGDVDMKDWAAVVETDYWGVVYGCHAFVPRLKKQGRGQIVNTSSTAGIIPVMGFASYNTAKAAVVSLSETLRLEMAPYNVGVTVVCPPVVKTNILENSLKVVELPGGEEMRWGMEMIETAMRREDLPLEEFARRVLRDIEKNKLYSVPKLASRLVWLGIRLSPSLNFAVWAFLSKHGLMQRFMSAAVRWGLT